ncbi:MAG: hypothetical protein KAI29_02210, partial [Cyclobacteriaceae bacterium]|nr:hypothetical protein [Cyclobacteriaceae bacterium]
MKIQINYLLSLLCIFLMISITAQANINNPSTDEKDIPMLENPMTVQYLKKNLRKSQPRLVLNSKIEKTLRKKLKTDPVVQNMYKAIQLNAAEVQKKPLLERKKIGRRLLSVSREMLWRMNMLGMVYRIDKDPEIL